MNKEKTPLFPDQIIPLALTGVVFLAMVALLYLEILLLNRFVVAREKIMIEIRLADILVGMTIYLKTAIDFAIFIGRLMSKFKGWKNRVVIEVGTALGNALGTFGILLIWDLFREVKFLMAIMIFIAALVLFRLAEEGLEHVKDEEGRYKYSFFGFAEKFEYYLSIINKAVAPVLSRLVPNMSVDENRKGFKALFLMSLTVPFILGLDDFAGYIPLFNVINVFGFAIGVFLGHMLLNILLFLSPRKTIKAVKNPIISFIGSLAFVALGIWGLVEVAHLVGIGAH